MENRLLSDTQFIQQALFVFDKDFLAIADPISRLLTFFVLPNDVHRKNRNYLSGTSNTIFCTTTKHCIFPENRANNLFRLKNIFFS